MNAMTTSATSPLKGKTKDETFTQPTLPSHWWNFYALVEQRRRSRFLSGCMLSMDLNSPLIDQSHGRVWPSFSPTKPSQSLLVVRSHRQDSSNFHPRPCLLLHHQARTNRRQYSAYRPGRTGCLRISLVGKYQAWGAFGGLSRLMGGVASKLLASPPAEGLSPLNG